VLRCPMVRAVMKKLDLELLSDEVRESELHN